MNAQIETVLLDAGVTRTCTTCMRIENTVSKTWRSSYSQSAEVSCGYWNYRPFATCCTQKPAVSSQIAATWWGNRGWMFGLTHVLPLCAHMPPQIYVCATEVWVHTVDRIRARGLYVVTANALVSECCCWKARRATAYGWPCCLEKCAVKLLYCAGGDSWATDGPWQPL